MVNRVAEKTKAILFGYFCIEKSDGTETILIKNSHEGSGWEFPIYAEFDPSTTLPDEAASDSVSKFISEKDFFSRDALQIAGLFPFQIFAVPLEKQKSQAYFCKARIQVQIGKDNSDFTWVDKFEQFKKHQNSCLHQDFLSAIHKFRIYPQAGFQMLECIDVLVFKKDGDNVEFLMLRREDRSLSVLGWEYSKGPVLFHETHREAAKRELEDETGINIENYRFIMDLGYQTVNVAWRKKNYDTMHLLAMTYLLTGNQEDIVPYKKEGLRRSTWMPLEKAKEKVWMQDYGPAFFDRWHTNKDYIMSIARLFE